MESGEILRKTLKIVNKHGPTSLVLTLTDELNDLNLQKGNAVLVTVMQENSIKKIIVEKVENGN